MMADEHNTPARLSRRSFIRHAAWAGAGVAVAVTGGIVTTDLLSAGGAPRADADFSFVQISDSHLGFEGKANPDVSKTFQQSIDLVNSVPIRPDFVIHTGDVTHFSTIEQFDQAKQMMTGIKTSHTFTLPGEHDAIDGTGQTYLKVFGAGTQGSGWYSFDHKGVHFLALVNTTSQQVLGHLGTEQLQWVKNASSVRDAHRRFHPRPPLRRLRQMGMGHGRCAAAAQLPEALWLGDLPQWAHPSDHLAGRGQRRLPQLQRHRLPVATPRAYRPRARPATKTAVFGLRVLTAAFLAAVAAIHLDLWANFGYRFIPNIGWLFFVASVSGFALGGPVLVAPRRLAVWTAVAATLLFAGLLGGLIISLNAGLLGFQETTSAPLFVQAVTSEALGMVIGTALTVRLWFA